MTTQPRQAEPSWADIVPLAARVQIFLVVVLLGVFYRGVIEHGMVSRWIHDGNWSHGWLIPVFSLYFLNTQRARLAKVVARPSYWGALVLFVSLGMYFFGAWKIRATYVQTVSVVGSIFGVVLLLGGWSVMRIAWFPISFLMLAIPLPGMLYYQLTFPMRVFASKAAAAMMPLFVDGLHTEAQAVVIDYMMPGHAPGQLNVEEACSGMRLMMAFVTLGVAMAYLGDRSWWQRGIMIAVCVPTALLCNVIRVTTTGLLIVHGREDLATGTPHQLLGMLMLALALGIYSVVGYILSHLFVDDGEALAVVNTHP